MKDCYLHLVVIGFADSRLLVDLLPYSTGVVPHSRCSSSLWKILLRISLILNYVIQCIIVPSPDPRDSSTYD